jgi:hypothetical protein
VSLTDWKLGVCSVRWYSGHSFHDDLVICARPKFSGMLLRRCMEEVLD